MPFLDTTDSVIAELTDIGRNALTRSILGEITFVIDSFAVGREGYDDANPVKVDPINAADVALTDRVFPAVGVDEEQRVSFDLVPDAGSFALTHFGNTTAAIPYTATAVDVENALNALTHLSGVTVTGSFVGGFEVTFSGADGQKNQPVMIVGSNLLSSGGGAVAITIETLQEGSIPAKAVEPITQVNPANLVVDCRLAKSEALYGLGEVGLYIKITNSIVPEEIGDRILFAIAHSPIQAKTDRHVYLYRFIVQF